MVEARRVGSARHTASRIGCVSRPNSIKSDVRQKIDTLHSYTVVVEIAIDGRRTEALFDSGASSSVMDPRFLASLPGLKNLDILDYNYEYSCAAPGTRLPSQGAVTVPVTFNNRHQVPATFVIADSDFPVIIGADFMVEQEVDLHFSRKGTYFRLPGICGKLPVKVYPRLMAQWVRTRITECIQPGEETAIAVRFVNIHRRTRPSRGTVGLLEPATHLREKDALVLYSVLETGSHSYVSLVNTGETPLLLHAGTVVGCWVPATVVSQDLQDSFLESIPDSFDVEQSRFDQGYSTDCDSGNETEDEDDDACIGSIARKRQKTCAISHVAPTLSKKNPRP